MMSDSGTKKAASDQADTDVRHEDLYEVILYNDDFNAMEFVVGCVMKVFGHSMELAAKIMIEAHKKGRAIAEVESHTDARRHKEQLESFGLTVSMEKV